MYRIIINLNFWSLLFTLAIFQYSFSLPNNCIKIYDRFQQHRELGFNSSNLPLGWKRTNNTIKDIDVLLMQNSYYKGSLNETGYFEIVGTDGSILDFVMLTGLRDRVFISDYQILSYLNKYPRSKIKKIVIKHTHPKNLNGYGPDYLYKQFSEADIRADLGTRQLLDRSGYEEVILESYIVYNSFWSILSSSLNRRTIAKFGYVVPR